MCARCVCVQTIPFLSAFFLCHPYIPPPNLKIVSFTCIYVRRKVRIRTIRGLYCANLGSSLCVEIRRSRKQSQDAPDGNVYCAHRGCATIQRSRTQTLDDSVALRTPCTAGSNLPEGFLAMIRRAALRTPLCTTCANSSNLPLA